MLSLATAPLTDRPARDTPRATAVTTPERETLDSDEPLVLLPAPLRGSASSLLPPVPSLLLVLRRRRPALTDPAGAELSASAPAALHVAQDGRCVDPRLPGDDAANLLRKIKLQASRNKHTWCCWLVAM